MSQITDIPAWNRNVNLFCKHCKSYVSIIMWAIKTIWIMILMPNNAQNKSSTFMAKKGDSDNSSSPYTSRSGLQSLIDIPIIGTNLLWTKVFGISSHHQWIDTLTRRRNILTKFHIWQFAWQQTQRETGFFFDFAGWFWWSNQPLFFLLLLAL